MKKAIVGKKLGMTQIFLPDGRLVPVTVIQAGPCTVVQKKTNETDGYEAVHQAGQQARCRPLQQGWRSPHPRAARVPV